VPAWTTLGTTFLEFIHVSELIIYRTKILR
jgi:hypothetical protein